MISPHVWPSVTTDQGGLAKQPQLSIWAVEEAVPRNLPPEALVYLQVGHSLFCDGTWPWQAAILLGQALAKVNYRIYLWCPFVGNNKCGM